ncbi:ACT domain-containing protein [Candidatus Micrarchaeota archaeon]|nr:ACT domain-containing protein [Candidatus Micrarchaeota archaeon]
MPKTSELVWLYVKRRPYLKEMLKSGVSNYSKLARQICKDAFGTDSNFYAVKASLLRIGSKLKKKEMESEKNILHVLRGTSLSIRNKIAVIISSEPLHINSLFVLKGKNAYTYIVESEVAQKIRNSRSIIRIKENLNLFILSSSEEIEETPGVISSILHMLASEGINIQEFISTYTETFLVIKEADTSKAYELLTSLTK